MEASHYFDLVSHPDRTLSRHLNQCDEISAQALSLKYVSPDFYLKSDIEQWRKLLVYFHDFGKATDYFQHRILAATETEKVSGFYETQQDYIQWFKSGRGRDVPEALRQDSDLGRHAQLGAYYLFSQFAHEDPVLQVVLLKVIQRHHGNLTNFIEDANNNPVVQLATGDKTLELLEQQAPRVHYELYNKILRSVGLREVQAHQWEQIRKMFRPRYVSEWEEKLKQANTYRYFFLQHYLFSLLLSADKGDMQLPKSIQRKSIIRENHVIDKDESVVEYYKTLSFGQSQQKPIDIWRESAYRDIGINTVRYSDASFFSVTLPTGMGKTLATYKAALLLQKNVAEKTGKVPRIIYCLPFTSVIDQNAAVLEDIFKKSNLPTDWISIHHYLSHANERYDDTEKQSVALDFAASEYMTEGWEQEVVVTTFVQFLESIFTNRNRAIRKFHNMTNSVIVLDEVQAIPPKYFEAVEQVFRHMAQYFGTKFLFVTATQPLLFKERADILELTDPTLEATNRYFAQMERIELDQSLLKVQDYKEIDMEYFMGHLIQDICNNADKSFLIINNTIKESQKMFDSLNRVFKNDEVIIRYLSASIIPYSRKKIIEEVKKDKRRQILISTQVVEAGVDIDFDVVYRDWAPLDSINQSAGRCNRNGIKGKGRVALFHSGKAKYIYDAKLLSATQYVLQQFDNNIPESAFLNLSRRYAQEVRLAVASENNASEKLKYAMKNLMLEDVNKQFKLIEDKQLSYNVFIPINDEAESAWKKYQEIFRTIEDRFERKAAIKRLRPEFLPFVTRFPEKKYSPPKDQEERFIIYDPNWEDNYNEVIGFIDPDVTTAVF